VSALEALGYSEFFRAQIAGAPKELSPGRIVGQHRREWDVVTEEGATRAVLAGKRWDPERGLISSDVQPTVGDWVLVRPGSPPVIETILTRRTELSRTSLAKRGAKQILVSNIDIVAVVAAFAHPDADDFASKRSLSPRRMERYLTAIKSSGAEGLVLLNKSDLTESAGEHARELAARLGDCPVIPVNCSHEGGLDGLRERLSKGTTIGFIGVSGVGKSSIVNTLLGREAQKVGAERTQDARGRHTTTHRELFLAREGFILIDTPGMREFALVGVEEADLEAFSDIAALARACQFRDCHHEAEPGCKVREAASSGSLDVDRLESYQTLRKELAELVRNKSVKKVAEKKRRRPPPNPSKRRGSVRDDWEDL
jgi:ribosome biogenesis GTPase